MSSLIFLITSELYIRPSNANTRNNDPIQNNNNNNNDNNNDDNNNIKVSKLGYQSRQEKLLPFMLDEKQKQEHQRTLGESGRKVNT